MFALLENFLFVMRKYGRFNFVMLDAVIVYI